MRAVTETDSGLDRGGRLVGTGLDVNALRRSWIDPDLSRTLKVSGEESRDMEGEGVFRVNESALSAMEGDLEAPRTLPLRTEKNAGDVPGGGPVVPGAEVVPGPRLDSFSSALIL